MPGSCQHAATQVELWAYTFPGFCPAGSHVDFTGPWCRKCPKNSYSQGQVTVGSCTPCDPGTFSMPGSTECIALTITDGWNLVFRQSYNPNVPGIDTLVYDGSYENVMFYGEEADPNYSRLRFLDEFRDPFDDKFFFMYDDKNTQQIWKQESNFVTTDVQTTVVQGLENIQVDAYCNWGGLMQSMHPDTQAWFDGSDDSGPTGARWWHAIGSQVDYVGRGTIPGNCRYETHVVELWAYIFPGYCAAGEHVLEGSNRCLPCPTNTFSTGPQVTATACDPCPGGTYAEPGASECKDYGIGAGWNTVFRHTREGPSGFLWSSLEQALWHNPETPDSDNYSILKLLGAAFYQNNRFRLKFIDDAGTEYIWRQASNPVESTTVQGYARETHAHAPGDSASCYWQGLAKSSGRFTYFDGSNGASWWWAIGSRINYNDATGTAGFIPGHCGHISKWVELQAYLFDGTCGAGEYLDAANALCAPCPANSITTSTSHTESECAPCEFGLVAPMGSSQCLDLVVGGGWTLLFRQTVPFWFTNLNDVLWLNAKNNTLDNYSILGALEVFRERGRFRLKYVNTQSGKQTTWQQTTNFVEAQPGETPQGLVSDPHLGAWQGLTASEGGSTRNTWFDGSDGEYWWWALASKGPHYSPNGIPGVWPETTNQVELWAYREYNPIVCVAGEYIDLVGICQECPQNTVSDGGLQYECTQCAAGLYAPPGSSVCRPCPPGEYWDTQRAECWVCPMNTFSVGGSGCQPCPDGEYSFTGSSACVAPIPCSEAEGANCHELSYCDGAACTCFVGLVGDGVGEDGCSSSAWTVRFSIKYVTNPGLLLSDGTLAYWDSQLRNEFAALMGLGSGGPPNFKTSMHHKVDMVEVDPTQAPVGLITINALFPTQAEAIAANATLATTLALDAPQRRDGSPPVTFSGIALVPSNVIGPDVYTWTAGTTSDSLQIQATGMQVDDVYFVPACDTPSGCWAIDVTYTLGTDAFSVLYLPHSVGDDTLSVDFDYSLAANQVWQAPRYNYAKASDTTFVASNFPCGSADYVPDATAYPPLAVTACCLPEFVDMYRPVQAFYDKIVTDLQFTETDCLNPTTKIPVFDRPNWADDDSLPELTPMLNNYVNGAFKGMSNCWIEFGEIVDAYIRQYRGTVYCDEVELRQNAGMLRGTVGVEHTVDTFIGIANFKPTGRTFLDSAAMQVNLHLEKTGFFSVSTHGENEYTFLEYVNLRLVAVYQEDTDLSETPSTGDDPRTTRTDFSGAAHYLQVTFTLGAQYAPNQNSGLIPLDSVRVGSGTFFSSTDMTFHPCASYAGLPDFDAFPDRSTFDDRFPDPTASPQSQMCAPDASMCVSPTSVPDNFVSFNVPLGIDYLPTVATEDMETLANVIFVHMVVSAIDADQVGVSNPNAGEAPQQMKTTLSASIPVVKGGVNIFCDQLVAKTDLQDVVNADLILGTAANAAELTRVRIFSDIASSNLDKTAASVFDTSSIEEGFMTLVVKGDDTYFGLGGTQGYGIQLEDVITVHIMEDGTDKYDYVKGKLEDAGDDNYADATTLNNGGYRLNGAFRFEIDRSLNRAHLHPTDDLLAECSFNAQRPTDAVAFPASCIIRRDVQEQGFPVRVGAAAATAQEVLAQGTADRSANGEFLQTVLGGNGYGMELGKSFSETIANKYGLNDRYIRAWFINPGYEWTPTQTNGQSIFTVSQRIFMFALINLDENLVRRRGLKSSRMLLQSVSGSGAGMAASEITHNISPSTLMESVFKVPSDNIAVYELEMQLTEGEACMEPADLQRKLSGTLGDYLTGVTSQLETVQILSLSVANRPATCGRRLQGRGLLAAFSEAVATVRMMLVFADSGAPLQFNTAKFAAMPGINNIEARQVPAGISELTDIDATPEPPGGSSGSNTALIAGICGGVAGAGLVAAGGLLYMRSRNVAEVAQPVVVQSIGINDLKAQLQDDA